LEAQAIPSMCKMLHNKWMILFVFRQQQVFLY